ncbi:MAG TPA: hypothetical protein VE783_00075, partial [Candidatus Limnocylindrales bacterium]|nr:hypothetical protein [Candidatus Limnocylindrales bacterium]
MRGCCIAAPEFYIQAVFRNDDRIIVKQRAVAVLEGPKSSVKVFTCNSKAREAGVFPGMSKAKAQSWQNILLLKRSQRSEENAQATLLDCGFAVSRLVENTYPGIVLCDVTGTERLLGPPENTAKKLLEIACWCGLDTNIAIAPNPDAALHAARGFPGITIIGSGQERRVLAPLPLEVLDANPETLDKLRSWGVRTFRDLADLPAEAIVQRLGPVGFRLQQMAQGCSRRELIPVIPAPSFQEKVEPEEPLDCLEAVGSTAQKLLDHIVTRLNSRSLAARELHLELALEINVDRELSSIRYG